MRRVISITLLIAALIPAVAAIPSASARMLQAEKCKAEFAATTVCKGQPTVFTNLSSGGTAWSWSFGSTLQNPTHIFPNAGVFNVTLTAQPGNCTVTHTVTVLQSPTSSLAIASTTTATCTPGLYSIPAQAHGCAISWTATNGMIQSGQGSLTITVAWNPAGPGLVSVTVSCQECCKGTVQLVVPECLKEPCCHDGKVDASTPNPNYDFCPPTPGYFLQPTLTVNGLSNVTQITADILSASISYASPSCGTGGPLVASFASPVLENGFTASVPVTNGAEMVWTSSSGVAFPTAGLTFNFIKIVLPPPPPNPACKYTLSLCVRYTFTDAKCNTCSIIKCSSFELAGVPPPNPSPC